MVLEMDYVEFESGDVGESRRFFAEAFGWRFNDYGPDYQEIANAGVNGGIATATQRAGKGPLVILKTNDLAAAERAVLAAGGTILVPAYEFPGGRRFHFLEPGGNELAVWSPVTA